MNDSRRWPTLWVCFGLSLAVYVVLFVLGPQYARTVPDAERPMLLVIASYVFAAAVSFVALWVAVRSASTRTLGAWVFVTSALFRLVMIATPPFQEIDIYRYLWDGVAIIEGVDPYRYAPQQVVSALDGQPTADPKLQRLVAAAEASPGIEEVVRTIHYAYYPSPYPPVSQAVFAAAAATSADGWSATARLMWLKVWLVGFDLATLAVVLALLHMASKPLGWAIAYGWCPLVIKEVAGSGHLDAIATFLAIAALALVVYGLKTFSRRSAYAGVVSLALGVGAKLFPVVLAPLVAASLLRRFGWRTALIGAALFVGVSAATLAPMLLPDRADEPPNQAANVAAGVESVPPPPEAVGVAPGANGEKTAGLAAFLSRWEMNDLIFMVVYENLRWSDPPPERWPWFDFTPASWTTGQSDEGAFRLARGLTLAACLAIALTVACRCTRGVGDSDEATGRMLGGAFLTLAWFWMLAPTQNPWYWCWVVPLLPWARNPAWLTVSVFAFAYYLRFYLDAHFAAPGFFGTPYDGEYFFYFVIPFFEHGLVLVLLTACWVFPALGRPGARSE